MVKVQIIDTRTGKSASIINGGALAVTAPHYNQIFEDVLDIAAQVYNIVPPQPDQYFVLDTISVYANKNVGAADATVTVYVAESADAAYTPGEYQAFNLELPKNGDRTLSGINVRTLNKGAYINAITDDDDVYVTVIGYYSFS